MMQLSKKLYSFDIFDTLVTRRVATPEGVFTLIQKKLRDISNLPDFFKENFCTIRIETERYARYNKFYTQLSYEVSFDEIYDTIANNYNLDGSTIEYIKQIELALEKENLVTITKNISKLEQSVKNADVVLITDMYFKFSHLRELLKDIHPLFKSLKIYSSADFGVSKSNGKLYECVAKNENIDYCNWTHFGDSYYSDVKQAKRYGIKAVWLKQEDLLSHEKYLLKNNRLDAKIQASIGAARLSRINSSCVINSEKFGFGASFAGPILYNYVDWVIRQSLRSGAKTLYFVSRDGYIPKKIADIIIESKKIPIQTKYIYGSRIAWRIPTEENYKTFIEDIFDEYRDKPILKLLAYRLSISEKELREILKIPQHLGLNRRSYKKKLCQFIIETPSIKEFILRQFKKKHDLLLSYLRQEIDFKGTSLFFVDLFGSGRTQNYLCDAINEIAPDTCVIFHYIATIYCANSTTISKKISYLKSKKYAHYWVELLARCLDGQTVSYELDGIKINPVLEKIDKIPMKNWGFESYLQGILSYTKNACMVESANEFSLCSVQHYIALFDYVCSSLDKNNADILGSIPYKDFGCESKQTEAAPKISILSIIVNFVLCRKLERISLFPFISVRRNYIKCESLLRFIKRFPTLQKFIFDIHFHRKARKLSITVFGIKIDMSRILQKGQYNNAKVYSR